MRAAAEGSDAASVAKLKAQAEQKAAAQKVEVDRKAAAQKAGEPRTYGARVCHSLVVSFLH